MVDGGMNFKRNRHPALLLGGLALVLAALFFAPSRRETSSTPFLPRPEPAASSLPVDPAEPPPRMRPRLKPMSNPLDRVSTGIVAAPAGDGADFVTRDRIANAFFTKQGVTFALTGPGGPAGAPSEKRGHVLRWGLEGAAEVAPRPEGERSSKVNVYKGERSTWKTDQATYSSIVYDDVRPGVDLVVESRPLSFKYTLKAERAADMGALRFGYGGAQDVHVVEGGAAVEVFTPQGALREDGLEVWQDAPEGRRPIEARYVPAGAGRVEISLGPVDPELPLTVDPVINWSGYLGGAIGAYADDYVYGVATDGAGSAYVVGYTPCINLPGVSAAGMLSATLNGTVDAFLMKLDTAAGTIAWATYIGGSSSEYGYGVAVDENGNPHVMGYTVSSDFPVTAGAYDTSLSSYDTFVMKFTPGGALTWSTFLGGSSSDYGQTLRVDPSGVYVGGYTYSSNFPIVNGFDASIGVTPDGFVAKLDRAGQVLLWSTYLGGSDQEIVYDLAPDSAGNVYVTGYTYSLDFPTTNGLFTLHQGSTEAFLTKISSTGGMLWSTFLGGTSSDAGQGVTVATDGSDEPVVVGYTGSLTFPFVPGSYDTTVSGTDAFVTRVKTNGLGLVYSTFLGGTSTDFGYGVAPGPNGTVYVVGQTYSSGAGTFPVLNAYRSTAVGAGDGFVTQVAQDGKSILGSTFLGGSSTDYPRSVAVDATGVYVAGYTYSSNMPTPNVIPPPVPMIDATLGGSIDGFLARLTPSLSSLTRASYVGGSNSHGDDWGYAVAVDPLTPTDVIVTGYTNSVDFPAIGGGAALDLALTGVYDVFVTRVRTTAPGVPPSIVWSTYLGGNGDEQGYGVTVDRLGYPYIVGTTGSFDFPLATPGGPGTLFDNTISGTEAFITCLNPTGTLYYSTFMGGNSTDVARAVAVDTNFNAYITGYTFSSNFPTLAAFDTTLSAGPDAFVVKLDVNGSGVWSNYLGGNNTDQGMGIAVNNAGTRVVVAGYTYSSSDFIPAGGADAVFNGPSDGFAAGITGTGALTWSRYLGGNNYDFGHAAAMDSAGTSAVVTGYTYSTDFNFPAVSPLDPTLSGGIDAFVTRLDPNTGSTVWSTFLGGNSTEIGYGVALDASANVYLTGYTQSSDFPTKGAVDATIGGVMDAYVTKLYANGSSIAWSTFLGGSGLDIGNGIAVDPTGAVYVTGETVSNNFPFALGLDGSFGGVRDAFVARLDNANPNPPSFAVPGGQFKTDNSPLAVGAWTSEGTVTIRATVSDSDDETVKLQVELRPVGTDFIDGTVTAESALAPSGSLLSVSVPLAGAAPQSYHWRARVVDVNGRTSSYLSFGANLESARDVGRDTLAPVTTIAQASPLYTTSSTVALTGDCADATSGVVSVGWTNAGNGGLGNAVPTTGTGWQIPSITLVFGANVITVTGTDGAGNPGAAVITVYRDQTALLVSITTPASNPFVTGVNFVNMSGTASDNINLFGVSWASDRGVSGPGTLGPGPGQWTAAPTLSPGLNVITITATDSAGNMATAQRTVNYDTSPPTITVTSHASGFAQQAASITLSGQALDNVGFGSVAWQNFTGATSGPAAGTDPWSASIPLVNGANSIRVTATDSVGLSTFTNILIYRDANPPSISITLPTPNPTFTTGSDTISLGGTCADDIGVQSIAWTRQAPPGTPRPPGVGVIDTPGALNSGWSATGIPLLGDADNLITVTVTDVSGRTFSDTITVFYDTLAASITIDTPATNPFTTSATSYLVSGTATDNVGVLALRVKNTTTNTSFTPGLSPALPATLTNWSATVDLVAGNNVITIEADDNIPSTTTVSITIIHDPTPPTVKITGPTTADDYYTGIATLAMTGTSADNRGVTSVTWAKVGGGGGSGGATGTNPWTIASIPLGAGSQVITVTAKDAAGNEATDVLTVYHDPTKPDISITSPSVSSTFVTTLASVALGGTASDDTLLGGVTWTNAATGSGGTATVTLPTWSVGVVALAPGNNPISVIATDAAGNLKVDTITVLYDTELPDVVIVSPATGTITKVATAALAGTASDDIGVVSVEWVNAANGASGTAAGGTAWSESAVTLEPGPNVITVTVTDAAANEFSRQVTIHYDDQLPNVAIATPVPGYSTTSTPVALAGTAFDTTGDLSVVEVTQVSWANLTTGGSGVASLSPGAWGTSVPLTSGLNSLIVTAVDAAGNSSSASINVTYDPAAPLVIITTPTTDLTYTTGSSPVVLSGTSSDDVGVTGVAWSVANALGSISGFATNVSNWSPWSASIDLAAGANLITITATDNVGRTGTSRVTVIYDPTAPSIAITSPTAESLFLTTIAPIAIGGAATDNLEIQSVVWANTTTGDGGTAQGTGAWTVGSVPLIEGTNVITVTATDGVGKTGQATVTVIYDGTAPTVSIATPTSSPTFSTSTRPITIGGSVGDNLQIAGVTWSNNRGGGGAATVVGTAPLATWSDDTVYLYPGPNIITVTATDGHGYTSTASLTITFIPEVGPPGIVIELPTTTGAATSATQMVTVSGSADDLVGVVAVNWRNLGTGVRGAAVLTGPATDVDWAADIPLANGANVIVVTAVDDAGNTAGATIVVTFASGADGVPPTVSVTLPITVAGVYDTNSSPVAVALSASDNVGVASVSWTNSGTGGNGTATPAAGTAWTTSVALAFGANVIEFTATDPAGNTATTTLIANFLPPIAGDVQAPDVVIVTPPPGVTANTSVSTIDLTGTASDDLTVAAVVWSNPATGETGSAEGTDAWTLTLGLEPGINLITVTAYDTYGKTDTMQLTVLYTPPPPPPEDVPAGSCGLVGLDAWLLLAGLAAWRRRR